VHGGPGGHRYPCGLHVVTRRPQGGTRAAQWEQAIAVLQDYVDAHGAATPTTHLVVDGFPLGRWVGRRREQYRNGTLDAAQAAELEALPGWTWGRTQQSGFEEGLTHLQTYVAAHGTADLPRDTVVDGFAVGDWAARRRQDHTAGVLRPDRAAALEALPGWRWRQPRTPVTWADGTTALRAWVTEHGTATVPPDTHYRGVALGEWVQATRRRRINGRLDATQAAELEALPGWAWGAFDARFQRGVDLLREHQKATGSASPDQFYVHPSGFTLGAWCGRVRTLYRTGDTTPERVHALESIPGWTWNPMADRWAATVQLLHACAEHHGGLNAIPRDTRVDGVKLPVWAAQQRHRHHHGRLTTQEITALEAVPGWWWTAA
jgi:hypothetical protein